MTIAWYVHHHGAGHQHRALAVLQHVRSPAVVVSQLSRPDGVPRRIPWVRLPSDLPDHRPVGDVTAGGRLHWAPPQQPTTRRWAAALLGALDEHEVGVMVSDVSVEATVLARTAGVHVASMRLHGARDDHPHRLGFDLSARAIAPYPEWFEQPGTRHDLRKKTTYVGGLSRFAGLAPAGPVPSDDGTVVVLVGLGGSTVDPAHLDRVAASSRYRWVGLGCARPTIAPDSGVHWLGRVSDPAPILASAQVVVSAAGHNSVMEIAALRRPLVCIPERRPFDEQRSRARLLADLNLAVAVDEWQLLAERHVMRAAALGGEDLGKLVAPDAAPAAARVVESLAA